MLLRVRACVLDMDDTVNRTSEAMDIGLRAGVEALWPALSSPLRTEAVRRYVVDEAGWFERFSTGRIGFREMRRGRLDALAAELGTEVDDSQFGCFEQVYRDAFERSCRAYEDALRLIGQASAAGVPIAVLSNSAEHMTRMKVNRLGLQDSFAAVFSCDQLPAGKPDPGAYRAVCQTLGCDPGEVGYVDDLYRDARGASLAGLSAIWVDRRAEGRRAGDDGQGSVIRVTSLDEIGLERGPACRAEAG
ncbi:putative hydrolase of the HAD superfamily [Propionibacterium cyclohexanicum]|uniref:Putative hydrolase of the HAD superfamily n=1 Tax=Propionibacterium cyclohexanicum TaxID=64702 RepID=A0A1H9SCZ8_9ACTN|nr:HAD family hydrolase [Propionibacterium cyclohexanicum]SER82243.1 putative hydrolase of the HAD superfamily [Propionibacterium cyclohexanicum]